MFQQLAADAQRELSEQILHVRPARGKRRQSRVLQLCQECANRIARLS